MTSSTPTGRCQALHSIRVRNLTPENCTSTTTSISCNCPDFPRSFCRCSTTAPGMLSIPLAASLHTSAISCSYSAGVMIEFKPWPSGRIQGTIKLLSVTSHCNRGQVSSAEHYKSSNLNTIGNSVSKQSSLANEAHPIVVNGSHDAARSFVRFTLANRALWLASLTARGLFTTACTALPSMISVVARPSSCRLRLTVVGCWATAAKLGSFDWTTSGELLT